MHNFMWIVGMIMELVFASQSADNGDVARTILYCFSAYVCLQFMKKAGDGDG